MPPEWELRTTAERLARRYLTGGLWNDDTLGAVIDEQLRREPGRVCRVWSQLHPYDGTVGDVHDLARRLAGGLRARGIGPGDVVAFQLPNWVEAAACFWGTSLLGAVLVPIVHFYGPKEVGYILGESRARALVTADRFGHLDYLAALDGVRPRLPDLEVVIVVGEETAEGERFEDVVDTEPLAAPEAVAPDTPAVVAYTSGTTADPKGVVHTHRSLLAEVRQLAGMHPGGARPLLVGAPVGHAIGMLSGLLLPLQRGDPVNLIDVWDPAAVLKAMLEADLSAGSGATFFFTSLLDHADCGPEHVERMGHIGLGGAPVPAAVTERASALGISVVRSYGSTEHPSTTGATHDEPEDKRKYTDGRPMAGVDLRLVDDRGDAVAPGEAGEILSRGPDLFAGYTNAEMTADAVDTDGWYHTGDVGVLDDDGWLTITDRRRDVIIRGGENISAAEVEALLAHLPGVAEVAVVAAPDPRLGEHGCALVRPVPGVEPPDLEAIRRHLDAAGLARQKWPEEVRPVDDFPRTPSGKIKKFVLRQQLRAEAEAEAG